MAASFVSYLHDDTPFVCSQRQFDAIYFDFSQAFDKVLHTLLLDKLYHFGLSLS
jgi:hypothetical protein